MTRRRDILTASGSGLLPAWLASPAGAQENSIGDNLSAAEKDNIALVDRFCQAWEAMDLGQVCATMSAQCVYRQSQNTPPVTGYQAITEMMQSWIDSASAITYEVLETFARGPVVFNHRIDIYHSDNDARHLEWEGVGLFLVADGLIQEWQDFTMRVKRGLG